MTTFLLDRLTFRTFRGGPSSGHSSSRSLSRQQHTSALPPLAAVVLYLCLCGCAGAVVFVDQNAPGPGHDGTSWDAAFLAIQEGVDAATLGGDVWVADGVYVENVVMGEGVSIYGGFLGAEPGGYEDSLDQRDFVNNVTTIDGNQSGSCVVMAVEARVDGFILTNGKAQYGGGVHCAALGETAVAAHNVIAGNSSSGGGGVYCAPDCSPLVAGNTIQGNSGGLYGGGIYCNRSSPIVCDNAILENRGSIGGGILCWGSSAEIRGNRIADNHAGSRGGGIACESSVAIIIDSVIEGNTAGRGGGVRLSGVWGAVFGNRIAGNSSEGYGGGIDCVDGSWVPIGDCVIAGNMARFGGGVSCSGQVYPSLASCVITDNAAEWWGGGIYEQKSWPVVTDCMIAQNSAGLRGGGAYLAFGAPAFTSTEISGNHAEDGGGIWCEIYCSATLVSTIITGNSASGAGGGIYCWRECWPALTNTTIAQNWASQGRGLVCDSQDHDGPSELAVANCILWDGGDEICNNDGSDITIVYSDVWGGWPGEGNMDLDPLFVDPENGDFHLLPDSPCIDAGSNDYVFTDEDIDGDPRIIWAMRFPVPYWPHPGYVDIGADEFVPGKLGWPHSSWRRK